MIVINHQGVKPRQRRRPPVSLIRVCVHCKLVDVQCRVLEINQSILFLTCPEQQATLLQRIPETFKHSRLIKLHNSGHVHRCFWASVTPIRSGPLNTWTTSSIGWTFPRGLNASSVWWRTGVCTDRHLATSLITSSQPLMLLLAAAVYDLPTGTVSLCLAVDSARTAVGRSTTPAWQSGTPCLMNLEILTALIVLKGSWKQFSLAATSASCALEVIFIMRFAI